MNYEEILSLKKLTNDFVEAVNILGEDVDFVKETQMEILGMIKKMGSNIILLNEKVGINDK